MKIKTITSGIAEDEVLFEPENDMDLFWIGVISSKNSCSIKWVNNEVKSMAMWVNEVVIGLGRKRD